VSFDATSLTAQLSEAADASALISSNYVTNHDVKIVSISFTDATKTILRFDFDASAPLDARGFEYSLSALAGIRAVSGRTMSQAEGSTLNWVYQPANGENAYAFPQPMKLKEQELVNFAGVPQGAMVVVMTLDGIELAEIIERDGNGGVSWRPQLPSGDQANTAIYLFKVVLADGSESSKKKFIIIR
jgi:hypothetical protein